MITKALIEDALESGRLYARMGNGNLWKLRRNGATKTWKTRPADYSIPCKAGLKATGRITETSTIVVHDGKRPANCYSTGDIYVVESI